MEARIRRNLALLLLPALIASGAVSSCTSAEKRERQNNVRQIRRFAWETLRFRRPSGNAADPKATPGGEDWASSPLPDERLDCKTLPELRPEGESPEAVLACVKSLKETLPVSYRLRRVSQPYLELVEADEMPGCVQKTLARIPVPREIFFQSNEEGELRCYSSRIDTDSDRVPVFGVKWPLSKTLVRAEFSPDQAAKSPELLPKLLLGVALGPYFSAPSSALAAPVVTARIVPDSICRQCLGEKGMLTPDGPPVRLWPD